LPSASQGSAIEPISGEEGDPGREAHVGRCVREECDAASLIPARVERHRRQRRGVDAELPDQQIAGDRGGKRLVDPRPAGPGERLEDRQVAPAPGVGEQVVREPGTALGTGPGRDVRVRRRRPEET
jgi:hypothetical protein